MLQGKREPHNKNHPAEDVNSAKLENIKGKKLENI